MSTIPKKSSGINNKKQSRPRREKKAPAGNMSAKDIRSQSRTSARRTARRAPGRASDLDQYQSAPAAVSRNRVHDVSYSNVVIGGQSGLRVSASVPLCQIGSDEFGNALQVQTSTGPTSALVSSTSLNPYQLPNTANWNGSSYISGLNRRWISPHVPLMSVAFDRYKMVSLGLSYEPQAAATLEDRLTLAWTDDPNHPFLSPLGILNTPTTQRSQLDLLVTKDSVAFMPWKAWSMKLPVATDPRFMYDTLDNAEAFPTGRFSQFGAISCISGVPAPAGQTLTYGILYIRITVDFFDPVPITHGGVLTTAISEHRARRLVSRSSSEAKTPAVDRQDLRSIASDDGDGYEMAPPRFSPAPSVVPGTPHYVVRSSPPDNAVVKVPSRK